MKKKNPTDATMRNVKAGAKRDVAMAKRVLKLESQVKQMAEVIYEHLGVVIETGRKSRRKGEDD